MSTINGAINSHMKVDSVRNTRANRDSIPHSAVIVGIMDGLDGVPVKGVVVVDPGRDQVVTAGREVIQP